MAQMPSELSVGHLERAKKVILQFPEVHRYKWIDGSLEEVEHVSKRAKVASSSEEAISASQENVEIVARLIEFLTKWRDLSPAARTRVVKMRVRDLRNLARREHGLHTPNRNDPGRLPCHDDDDVIQELHQQLFCRGCASGCRLDDGHVVLAGLELKLLTPDVIREHGREEQERRQNIDDTSEDRAIDFYSLHFSPGSDAKHAMADLFWEGRDFEWVVSDAKVNNYWKSVNRRVRCVRYCSFARQELHLTDDAVLLEKILKPFGPTDVFIPETARICLATCAMSLIKQKDFRRQNSLLSQQSSPHAELATSATDRYTSMHEMIELITPGSQATYHLAGYESSMQHRDALSSFFAPEGVADPLDSDAMQGQQRHTESLYKDLHTIYLPLLVETGRADDTSPDMSRVVAILVANPCFDILPPVIFIDDRFTPAPKRKYTVVGGDSKKLTKQQMAPIRKWIKAAFLGCNIFKKWCIAHSVALDCKFADEHPAVAVFGGS